jgi:hypothetical protein
MMEGLPTEMLDKVLFKLDVPAKVILARCNLTLQQRAYRDCSNSWAFMPFCRDSYRNPDFTSHSFKTTFTPHWLESFYASHKNECTRGYIWSTISESDFYVQLMPHLREANAAKAQETLYSSCRESVVNESNQLLRPFDGTPVNECNHCGRKSSCEVGIRDCRYCSKTFLLRLWELCDCCAHSSCTVDGNCKRPMKRCFKCEDWP